MSELRASEADRPMQARDIMTPHPASVTPATSLTHAAQLMKSQNVGMLPVVDDEGSSTLVGVITDRDIAIRHVAEGHTTNGCEVREAMSVNLATCPPDAGLGDVMEVMGREQVRRIPIVDERGVLVGVVSQADLVLQADDALGAERTIEQISAS
jgi:CBS domain-containing protein